MHLHTCTYTHPHTHYSSAKVTLENKNGLTALDVAKNWGDEVIFSIVYARTARLPPPVEKKGTCTALVVWTGHPAMPCRSGYLAMHVGPRRYTEPCGKGRREGGGGRGEEDEFSVLVFKGCWGVLLWR